LVPPPADDQPQTCWRCRTWNDRPGEDDCWNCAQVAAELEVPAVPLDLISLYRKPSELREWLTCYKGRLDGSDPFIPEYVDIVRAMLARFFQEHGDRMSARAPADCIVVVPSTHRPPPHPLHTILADLGMQVPLRTLLRRGDGDLGFNRPARSGFAIAEKCSPQRVLLVDDVYTTGARINSAAVALADGGHELCGAFVMARRVNPDYQPAAAAFWEQQSAHPFDWSQSPVVNRR
jgi:hypothetical protein